MTILSIILSIIAVVAGGILITSLNTPLASLKDMFIAFIDLVTDNAIWFIFVFLLFVVAFSVIKKVKFAPIEHSNRKQQKIDNQYRQQKFEAEQRQLKLDNEYRDKLFNTKYGGKK